MREVQVWHGDHGDPVPLFGPMPGIRSGDTLAYEFELPPSYLPWEGKTRLERTFVLLDLGVSFSQPVWQSASHASRLKAGPDTWYVDLVHITDNPDEIIVRDLYIDVMVPTDGRHQRELDLDEYADAMESGALDPATAIDGLRRWQRFLDRHLHGDRDPQASWTDFPPARIRELADLPAPLGPVVTVPE
ncbi:MAG TPA: DUF402 domain-containing protein [Pseudonocardiaceae bacterium]|nr:DUF402 domain-containing protein [Pseudonocardiaceae bacterium]